jgi:hypothetical protein
MQGKETDENVKDKSRMGRGNIKECLRGDEVPDGGKVRKFVIKISG